MQLSLAASPSFRPFVAGPCRSPLSSTTSSPTAASASAPGPGMTHVLCCPGCSFMSLQADLLAGHVHKSHRLASVTVYRCCICCAVSTQRDIMREHAQIYHGLPADCSLVAYLSAEVIEAPGGASAANVAAKNCGVSPAAPSGSKKRKSTVPERVPCQAACAADATSETSALVADAAAAPESQKPNKLRKCHQQPQQQMAVAVCDFNSPATGCSSTKQRLHQLRQQLSTGVWSGGVRGNAHSNEPQDEAALDLSVKVKAPPCATAKLQSLDTTQQKQQQQQQQLLQQQQQQRQNFSSVQNAMLQQWFAQHRDKPYPGTEDTKALAQATGLNYSQVKKWFANKRMRSKGGAATADVGVPSWGSPDTLLGLSQLTPVAVDVNESSPPSEHSATDFDNSDELQLVVEYSPSP